MIDYSEKRDFIRMPVRCPILLHDPDTRTREEAELLDLSATGIRFVAQRPLDPDARLQITVSPKNPITPPFEAAIVVIRCHQTEQGHEVAATIATIAPATYAEQA